MQADGIIGIGSCDLEVVCGPAGASAMVRVC